MASLSFNILPLMGLNPAGDIGPYTVFRTRRSGVVWFPRAPPKMAPSYLQRRNRNTWSFAARVWSGSTPDDRQNWMDAARRAQLSISGYNLFIFYQVTKDRSVIETIQRKTGIVLL